MACGCDSPLGQRRLKSDKGSVLIIDHAFEQNETDPLFIRRSRNKFIVVNNSQLSVWSKKTRNFACPTSSVVQRPTVGRPLQARANSLWSAEYKTPPSFTILVSNH